MFSESNESSRKQKNEFMNLLQKFMEEIIKNGINSLIICEFDWKSWMNKSQGFRDMAKALQGHN